MCLDSEERILQKETRRRENILGFKFFTQNVMPFGEGIYNEDVRKYLRSKFCKNSKESICQ